MRVQFKSEREKEEKRSSARNVFVVRTYIRYKSNSIYQSEFRQALTEKNTLQYILDVIWIIHWLFLLLFVCLLYSIAFPRCCQMIMDLRPLTAHKRSICLFLRVSSKTLRVKNRIYQFHVIVCAAVCFIAMRLPY